MQIVLDASTERRIRKKLEDGRYSTASDVLSAAMDALARQEERDAAIADIRAKIAIGVNEANRGELTDGDEFFAELEREAEASRNSKIA
jgi:antitoxin ParD1/3/4